MMNRITRRAFWLLAISAVFSGAFAVAEGCGSDSFTAPPSTDGGNVGEGGDSGGSVEAGGGGDGSTGCLQIPANESAGDVPFCNAFAEVYDRCGSCEPCRQQDEYNCGQIGDSLSDSFKAAIVTCKDTLDCTDLQTQTLGDSPCLTQQMIAATPTAAQTQVQVAYCSGCRAFADAGAIDCDHFFVQTDGGLAAGAGVLYVNDQIAADLQAQCGKGTTALGCNAGVFELCGANQLCNGKHAAPKTTCMQGLCK
jgi:hypothetical protein